MGNQFFGFSPESFEQFVRTLVITLLGPGVISFGNGKDGGREATFNGCIPYPHPPADCWNGYGVIQAKCKEKAESTSVDQQWALKQLKTELESFVQDEHRTPKPEYYIFVTNVELSSVAVTGGKDLANSLLRSYYDKLPLKGHAIWDSNQLAAYLSTFEVLRRTYQWYLTPGDLLAAMLAQFENKQPDADTILTTFLDRELRADEYSRLEQAGHVTDTQLQLAHLFFDLPTSKEQQLTPPNEQLDSEGKLPSGVLNELLRDGCRRLTPDIVFEQEELQLRPDMDPYANRYVLLGGPGSGKSTVTQFLAQIHRAAILERRPAQLLEPVARSIIKETRSLCDRDGLPWPATPRYPLRVELSRFAKALASTEKDHVDSLEEFLLKKISHGYAVWHETLLEWLGTCPWILILDGLDEVPPTSNRTAVVTAVNNMLAGARLAGSDLFVVATSRHSSYNSEFAGGVVGFRHILPLSPARALRYVEQYASARYGRTDKERASDIVDKLREGSKRPLTAQLMSTPLQVTFLATVIAAKGDPGEGRWQLCDSYYRTIYDRERQKAVPPYDTVLSKQQALIDRLHHDIGFWLQYKGELSGSAAVSLPIQHFEKLVTSHLAEQGYEGENKATLTRTIVEAANDRLVFLAPQIPDELSFGVRSLQEFMAAECLTTGDSTDVRSRLRSIAPSPYWRNVFLFAADKCFKDAGSRHIQDAIRTLCEDLNREDDELLSLTHIGSELALDVLQSGAVSEAPAHGRHLAKVALELLSEPYLTDDGFIAADERLASIYRPEFAAIFRDALETRLGQNDPHKTHGAWPLALRLCELGPDWACLLRDSQWPRNPEHVVRLARSLKRTTGLASWVLDKLEEIAGLVSPEAVSDILWVNTKCAARPLLRYLSYHGHRESEDIEADLNLASLAGPAEPAILNTSPIKLRITPSSGSKVAPSELVANSIQLHPGWIPHQAGWDFANNPTLEQLVSGLRNCVDHGLKPSDGRTLGHLPWPLATCLEAAETVEQLRCIIAAIEENNCPGSDAWSTAESRWKSRGIVREDFSNTVRAPSTLYPHIADHGVPYISGISIGPITYTERVIAELMDLAAATNSESVRDAIVWCIVIAMPSKPRPKDDNTLVRMESLLRSSKDPVPWRVLMRCPVDEDGRKQWIAFYNYLGQSHHLSLRIDIRTVSDDQAVSTDDPVIVSLRALEAAFLQDERRIGLLRVIGRVVSTGFPISDLPAKSLELIPSRGPMVDFAVILIRLTQPTLGREEATRLADQMAMLLAPIAEPGADSLLFRTVQHHSTRVAAIEHFLLRLHHVMPVEIESGVAECERLLRKMLRRRPSALQATNSIAELKLPVVPDL